MGFAHSQNTVSANVLGAATSLSAVLANNPAATDVICCGQTWSDGTNNPPASLTIADANSNSYTKSTNSPIAANNENLHNFYLNNAPANASKTITSTFSNTGAGGFAEITADDFTVSGGSSAFDTDAKANGTGTTVNTPTVTRTGNNELMFFYVGSQNGVSSVDTPWTLGAITPVFTNATGYILDRSVDTAVAATQANGTWDAVGMSFSLISPFPGLLNVPITFIIIGGT